MQNPRVPQQESSTDPAAIANPRIGSAHDGTRPHFALNDDEATLVHLVAEGFDIAAIAVTTAVSEATTRERLRALASRLAVEAADGATLDA